MPGARLFNAGLWLLLGVVGCVPTAVDEVAGDPDGGRPLLIPLPEESGSGGCPAAPDPGEDWVGGGAGAGGGDEAPGSTGGGPAGVGGGAGGQGASDPDVAPGPDAGPPAPQVAVPDRPGAIVITEWMANPAALSDVDGEWIELHNPGPDPLDLGGCEVAEGPERGASIGALVAPAGSYVTLARRDMPGFVPDALVAFTLRNGSDAIVLRCAGITIDSVVYAAETGFAIAAGVSNQLDPSALDAIANDRGEAWCAGSTPYAGDLGTPGEANLPCAVPDLDAGMP